MSNYGLKKIDVAVKELGKFRKELKENTKQIQETNKRLKAEKLAKKKVVDWKKVEPRTTDKEHPLVKYDSNTVHVSVSHNLKKLDII